jgi:hypothetical protein
MSYTALSLINSSLRLIGVLAGGEQSNGDDASDALQVLSDMIDSWNIDRLAIFTTSSQDFPFVLGQQTYTMGPGGNFDTARPARIDGMSTILLQPNPANPIEVPLTMYSVQQWQDQVPVKVVDGTFPQICYDDGGFPLRTLNFWPIPSEQQNDVRIYSWQALAAPPAFGTTIAFPPGYAEAFRFNLAVRLAPEYAAPISPIVQTTAIESLARLKTINAPDMSMQSDLMPQPSGYNWSADMFGNPYS